MNMLFKIIFYVTEDFKNSTIKQFKCEKRYPAPIRYVRCLVLAGRHKLAFLSADTEIKRFKDRWQQSPNVTLE